MIKHALFFTYTYKAPFLSNADYEWSITNGYIVSGQYDHEVVVYLSPHSSNQSVLNVEITNHCTTAVYGQKIITHGDPPFPEEQCFTPHPGKPLPIGNTFDENNILIYPNPAESSVTVLNITDVSVRIIVMDVTGRIIMDFPVNSERETQINTAGLPAGAYLMKFMNENRSSTKKLIIKNHCCPIKTGDLKNSLCKG